MSKLIICGTCGLEKIQGGKNICNSCLYKRKISTPEGKEKLRKKKRLEYVKRKGLPLDHIFVERLSHCKYCKKEIPDDYRWCKELCQLCGKREYRKRFPEKYENEKNECLRRQRIKNGIDPNLPRLIAPKGSGYIGKNGYKTIYKPNCENKKNSAGQVLEHTWVMSQYLGRPLRKGESVHHKNGIRHDNRIENLELWSSYQPSGQRVDDKIQWCKYFLENYEYKVIKE